MDKAWSITEKCRFKILTNKSKPSSPEKAADQTVKKESGTSSEIKEDKESDQKETPNSPFIGQSESNNL